jgi:prepilin-type N-terminal cleavage/methylation domain-containing protein
MKKRSCIIPFSYRGFTPLEIKNLNQESRRFLTGFTLIELLVVISIIALLMAILMPALNRVKNQARTIACQANLREWALIWHMYTTDNNGYFDVGLGGESETSRGRWTYTLRDYYKDPKMGLCPTATKPLSEGGVNPFSAWGKFADGSYASYGENEWLCNRGTDTIGGYIENYWKKIDVRPAENIPIFLDCFWYDIWPFDIDRPPDYDGSRNNLSGSNEMRRVCLNRHKAAVNSAFLDWSVRKVGLKELWTFKWHRNFDVNGMWTIAGGVQPSDWPEWMRGFKDY